MMMEDLELIDLKQAGQKFLNEAAVMLYKEFLQTAPHSWNTMEAALNEVRECVSGELICIGLAGKDRLICWAGLRPMYGHITWELHPMVVAKEFQGKGMGKRLIAELEAAARARGILTIVLGTDDEIGRTSLSGKDLYKAGILREIKKIKNLGNHPYEFYRKMGYAIIGVIPDANGIGKPDIWMGKRLD